MWIFYKCKKTKKSTVFCFVSDSGWRIRYRLIILSETKLEIQKALHKGDKIDRSVIQHLDLALNSWKKTQLI